MRKICTYIIILMLIGLFTGCRKSSNARSNSRTRVAMVDGDRSSRRERVSNNQRISSESDNNIIEDRRVSNNRKYDGAEIFKKYNTAVFMVYTSDEYVERKGLDSLLTIKDLL